MTQKKQHRFFVALYGPTGVGKTAFADQLAEHMPIEIINMDSGQLYKPLTIGTAKPDWHSSTTPHHLFDVINIPRDYSVAEYRAAVIPLLEDIWQRNNIPVFVGGSGFYLKSLLFPPQSEISIASQQKQNEAVNWHKLYKIDPERARAIHKNDIYRITRALDLWRTTGKKPSHFMPKFDPPAPGVIVKITRDRTQLYMHINERTKQMVSDGWLDEVRTLYGTSWESFLKNKKLIGYDDLLEYLAGLQTKQTFKQTCDTIARKTRNYAKRQHTFWRMLSRAIMRSQQKEKGIAILSADLTLSSPDLYIKSLVNYIIGRVL